MRGRKKAGCRLQWTVLGDVESAKSEEGRAFVGPVGDAEDAVEDGDGSAEADVRGDQ